MKQPNPKAHFIISLFKSLFRIVGCSAALFLVNSNLLSSISLLALGVGLAEILGILEELF